MPPELPLSVVLPLEDHRGFAVRSARAWAHQTLTPSCYEIVAVSGGDRRLADEVRGALRDRDRLVELPGRNEIELYEGGARAASGTVLLFTESHCIPESDTAEALLKHFHDTGGDAATLASGHLPGGRLAALEAELGDRALERCPAERWWAVASLRGLAVRRDVFRQIGGFETRFERFAETVLAVELERRGSRARRVAAARVLHGDCARPAELERALLSLGRGRARLLEDGVPDRLREWLGDLDSVSRADVEPRVARAVCLAALRTLSPMSRPRDARLARAARTALSLLAPVALLGHRGAWLSGRLRARLAFGYGILGVGSFEERLGVYERAWRTVARCGETEVLGRRALAALPEATFDVHPGDADADLLLGFHGRERDGEGSFRWSGPFGLVRLSLPRGTWGLTAHLMRPPGNAPFALFWNGEPIVLEEPGVTAGGEMVRARVAVNAGGEQHLVVLAAPFSPRTIAIDDARTLGVAVRRLSFAPC